MSRTPQSSYRRIAGFFLALLLVIPMSITTFPRPAHALFGIGDIVHDPIAYVKEIGLDTIGWRIAKTAVASMQRSLVNWINSGFDGSPAFATDLRQNLLGVQDAVVGYVVGQIAGDVAGGLIVNSPYQEEIATAIRTGYYLSTGGSFYVRNPFTLNQYSQDPRRFLTGDFSQGGFNAWHAAVTTCQNNPYCAYQIAAAEVEGAAARAGGQRLTELNWGNGFLSYRGPCRTAPKVGTENVEMTTLGAGGTDADGNFSLTTNTRTVSLAKTEDCADAPILTPGTVIEGQLNEMLPKGAEGLVTADEIDEVIGALLQQLVNKVVGSTGLLGVSAPAAGGGRSYIDEAINEPTRLAPASIDPVIEARLSAYETSWTTIGSAAARAIENCPDSVVAKQAFNDAARAQAEIDGARRALQESGATVSMLGDLLPNDAEVFAAQAAASGADGSTLDQLQKIQSVKNCSSN
ncbi:MAG: hypothetical protein AAB582_00040 [Patescibacteria group bacterium]